MTDGMMIACLQNELNGLTPLGVAKKFKHFEVTSAIREFKKRERELAEAGKEAAESGTDEADESRDGAGETVESLVSAAVNLNAGFRVLGTLLIAINFLL